LSADFRVKGVGVGKLEWLPFRVVSIHLWCIVWFCYEARMWQTDRIMTSKTALV